MMDVRSYRRVFDLERRIYRVDRLRLNPAGVPVRGIVYFLVIVGLALLAARLPLLALVASGVPWYLRDVALPGGFAALLTVIRIEGRPFHLAAQALLRYRAGWRRLSCLRPCGPSSFAFPGARWMPEQIVLLPDGSEGRMRRLRYAGPGAVLVAVAHHRQLRGGMLGLLGRRQRVVIRQRLGAAPPRRGQVIVLERAAQLHVR
jgi:hypothetical protein